jgi:hypothetical protein
LGIALLITEVVQILGVHTLFHRKMNVLIFTTRTKTCWATILGDFFSQAHLVTLVSGSDDYLTGSPAKSVKRRGPSLPSPVKFHVVETAADDDNNETGQRPVFNFAPRAKCDPQK